MRGKLFVISAPSGTGKTTILKKVMAENRGLAFSVSHTTRSPRAGEINGLDYYFVTNDDFREMITQDAFLEWAQVHDNFYGTSRGEVEKELEKGRDVVLDIDIQGARLIREKTGGDCCSVFIAPPSSEELRERLGGRGSESEKSLKIRLENSLEEMKDADRYDYLIVNDRLEEAVRVMTAIILAERSRQRRDPDGTPVQFNL